jgi:hypothetical protein
LRQLRSQVPRRDGIIDAFIVVIEDQVLASPTSFPKRDRFEIFGGIKDHPIGPVRPIG